MLARRSRLIRRVKRRSVECGSGIQRVVDDAQDMFGSVGERRQVKTGRERQLLTQLEDGRSCST